MLPLCQWEYSYLERNDVVFSIAERERRVTERRLVDDREIIVKSVIVLIARAVDAKTPNRMLPADQSAA